MDPSQDLKEKAMGFMKSVAQRSGDPFYTVSPGDGFRFVFVNDAACRHFGRNRKELLTLSISDVDPCFPPDQWSVFWEELRGKGAIFFETIHRHADGREIPVAISTNLFAQEGRELFGGCIHDLSEHRQTEEALRDSEEMLRVIFNSTYDGILLHTADGTIFDANESFLRMYGVGRDGAQGLRIEDISSPAMSMETVAAIWSRVLEGETPLFEWKGRRVSDGREFDVEVYLRKLYVQGREAILANVRDITPRKEIERVKNEFISTAAHELRTPLTTVIGYLDLLRDEGRFTPEERREFFDLVCEKSGDLERIVRDLLDLSRVQSGELVSLDRERADLAFLVRHAVAPYVALYPHCFEIDFPESPVELCLDPGKIRQVIDNLLGNALKFSPQNGSIRITGRPLGKELQVTVADEGIGMRPDQVERIFERFYRADASNTAAGGFGLGMSIVKNIVEAHGGRIWIESEPGRGTRVHFTLPMDENH